eukprot:16149-Heterococcus_DN1.PRE.3
MSSSKARVSYSCLCQKQVIVEVIASSAKELLCSRCMLCYVSATASAISNVHIVRAQTSTCALRDCSLDMSER